MWSTKPPLPREPRGGKLQLRRGRPPTLTGPILPQRAEGCPARGRTALNSQVALSWQVESVNKSRVRNGREAQGPDDTVLKWAQEAETSKQNPKEVETCPSLGVFKPGRGSIWAGVPRKG